MHRTRCGWTRLLAISALSAIAGFAGYRSSADTITKTRFKGYDHLAQRFVDDGTNWGYAENWVTASGVTGPGQPQPVSMASAYAEIDTPTDWNIIHTMGQQAVGPGAIQESTPSLNRPGGANFTLPGVHLVWTDTGDFTETPVDVHSEATLSPSNNKTQGTFSEHRADAEAGVVTRAHSVGRRDNSPTGFLSVTASDGAEPVPAGAIGGNSWMGYTNNGTLTKIEN